MISRRTCSVPKQDVVFPWLHYSDSRCSQTCHRHSQVCCRRSQVLPGLLSALPGLSPALPATLKAGRNAPLGSDTLLKLTHLSLHSTSSQTLLEASSAANRFCWCRATHIRLHAASYYCCVWFYLLFSMWVLGHIFSGFNCRVAVD